MAHERVAQILRLVDGAGAPCAGVTLTVLTAQGPVPEMGYKTGEDGRVQLGLPPGPAVIEAITPDGRRQRLEVQAAADAMHEHELRMD